MISALYSRWKLLLDDFVVNNAYNSLKNTMEQQVFPKRLCTFLEHGMSIYL